jgi:hypothetical protein
MLGLPWVFWFPDMTAAHDDPSVEPVARRGGNTASGVVLPVVLPDVLEVSDDG